MPETLKNNEQATEQQATGWENMDAYRKVDTREYVEQGLADGSLEVFEAAKHARIGAVKGEIGQEVVSWSEDENGNPIQEKVDTVTADEETGETGWVATKTDTEGNPIIDKNGNLNQWIISDATFKKKYEVDPDHPDIFKPVGGPQKFVQTRENLTISQWGDEMKIPRGSFINITNPDDMYAINPRDFEDTYTKTETPQEQPDTTVDHRGREYINLDKIDVSDGAGQMEFLEAYANNAINRVMTAQEDFNDEAQKPRYMQQDWEQNWKKEIELRDESEIAEMQQRAIDDVRDTILTAAAEGREEPDIIDILEIGFRHWSDYSSLHGGDNKEPAYGRLLTALKDRLNSQPK